MFEFTVYSDLPDVALGPVITDRIHIIHVKPRISRLVLIFAIVVVVVVVIVIAFGVFLNLKKIYKNNFF